MKAIKIKNNFQLVKEVPKEWANEELYTVLKTPIRPNQKHCLLSDAIVDETKQTITFFPIDLTELEYQNVLKKEGLFLLEELKNLVCTLELGAKRIAIGKTGSRDYIESQERIYVRKYKVSKGELKDYNHLLEDEANEVGVEFNAYKAMIIEKYEFGFDTFQSFLAMIERARSKTIFFIENNKNYKAKELIELMKSINSETSITEIMTIMTIILNYK